MKYPIATIGGIFALTMSGALHAQENKLPNVVIFLADDISYDDFGCYGNQAVKTPRIDGIAKQGIRFTNFFLTASSCSPSRASLLSGRYPHNTGAAELHTYMSADMPVFPKQLKQHGYFTAHSGKWHLGEEVKQAFDVVNDQPAEIGDGGEDGWLNIVRTRPKDKPFFFYFAALDAHRPWGKNSFSGTHDPALLKTPPYLADQPETKIDLAKYYDEISRFDYFIGLIEDELRAQGALDNTIIMIMADNGRPFPGSKTRVYDRGMKSPFIVKWNKGIRNKGAVCQSLVSVIDIAPTISELAGTQSQPSFQGKSFSGLLKKTGSKFRNYVFADHNWHDYEACERMVRTQDFMYVLNLRPNLSNNGPADSNRSPSFQDLLKLKAEGKLNAAQSELFITPRAHEELFNLANDPMQLVNLASLPAYSAKLAELRQVMNRWRDETADETPEKLTPDWFDRNTGDPLPGERQRGQMPGGEKALKTNSGGPF